MNVLLTGGAGYIGSHTVRELINRGHRVHVLDNLTSGHRSAIDPRATFSLGDCSNLTLVNQLLQVHEIDAVMHFAASSDTEESVLMPEKYYQNNLECTLSLLRAMEKSGTKKFIFSSTAAVYGNPEQSFVNEDHLANPINPYGSSKRMVEIALEEIKKSHPMSYVILRYFNAAGASPDGSIGEDHRPETHLIPKLFRAALRGEIVPIYGTDYPTPDGTCIRDYVHVCDIASAHALAFEYSGPSEIFNLGSSKGFSVREIVLAFQKVTGATLEIQEFERRLGDPAILVADCEKIRRVLNWKPQRSDIQTILRDAWLWHRSHPQGFSSIKRELSTTPPSW